MGAARQEGFSATRCFVVALCIAGVSELVHCGELRGAGQSQEPSGDVNGTSKVMDQDSFVDMFTHHVATTAAQACRGNLNAQSAEDSCPCVGGGHSWGCCLDGGIDAAGAGGGSPFDETTKWSWLARPGFNWTCTAEAGCQDKYSNGLSERGRDIVHVPQGATCDSPRVLMVHGDSWIGGGPNETGYLRSGSRMASMTGAVVMAIDYPLAPTCLDFPACHNVTNAKTMLGWILRSAEYLATELPRVEGTGLAGGCRNEPGAGPPLLIFGDSSGGGSAYSALLALSSQADALNGGRDRFAGAVLWSGWYDMRCTSPTYISNAFSDVPKLMARKTGEAATWKVGDVDYAGKPAEVAWQSCEKLAINYAGSYQESLEPLVDVASAGKSMLQGLPPIYMSVGGSEVLLGENAIVAQLAAAADPSNEVVFDVFDGMFHVFPMYSEGCSNKAGVRLWQADLVWERSARFVRDVAATGHAPCAAQRPTGAPLTTWHMTRSLKSPNAEGEDWAPAGPDGDGFFCAERKAHGGGP